MNVEPYRPEPIETFQTTESWESMRAALAYVRLQLGRSYPLVIGGEKVETMSIITSTNPSNPGEVVGKTAKAGIPEADAAVSAAWKAFGPWKNRSQEERSRTLLKAAAIMKRRKRELEAWMVLEIGKNWVEASADVSEAIDFVTFYAHQALRFDKGVPIVPVAGEDNACFYIPLGVGVVIAPWNFPLAILAGMVAGPIAVGNTVIAKPAEDTVIMGAKLFEIFEEAGLPPGVANFLPGSGSEIGAYLVSHPRTRFINFTGSLEVGLRINEAAAKPAPGQIWLKRVFLELGGKDGLIVDETADLEAAAQAAVQSAFGFQGQKCSACSRLIVVKEAHEPLMERILDRAGKLAVGPAEENPDMGPVASEQQEATVTRYLEAGKQEASLVLGAKRLEGRGYFFSPSIFDQVDPHARIAQEEIFGPVLSVIQVPDFGTALEVANDTRFGLTGGVFSRSRERLEQARREFHVGNLYFNRKITGALVGVQPFGGFNLSGTDTKAGGPEYLANFLQLKSVTEKF